MNTVTPATAGSRPVSAAALLAAPPAPGDSVLSLIEGRLAAIEDLLILNDMTIAAAEAAGFRAGADSAAGTRPARPQRRAVRRTRPCHLQVLPGGRK